MTAQSLYDVEAEDAVLGAALYSDRAAQVMLSQLTAADFGKPSNGAIFTAIADLRAHGAAIDTHTCFDQLRRSGEAWPQAFGDLTALLAEAPAASAMPRYAEIVVGYAMRRRLAAEATALQKAAFDLTADPGETLDTHRSRLAAIDSPLLTSAPGDIDVDQFANEADESGATVVPQLLDQDERLVTVAPEGVGKSELYRQWAVCVAYGLHPLNFHPVRPVPALLVDLENPRQLLRRRLRYLTGLASAHARCAQPASATLWHRPGGIDLRRRSDRLAFEDVLRRRHPKLVVLGPVYKSYVRKAAESDEQVAAEVQAILDDLRTRYQFALMLEHHAPQATNGYRELRPFGSSLWLRWPEYGIRLAPDRERPQVLRVGRWRGDRAEARWPHELHRSGTWPWVGYWDDGGAVPPEQYEEDDNEAF